MALATPPPGYVGIVEARQITGYGWQTIHRAAKSGDLKAMQRVKGSQWFFKPEDLRAWRGIEEPATSVAS